MERPDLVSVEIIEINENKEMAREYGAMSVPRTFINEILTADGLEDPISGQRIEWSRVSHGGFRRDSEGEVFIRMPCDSYEPSLAIMSGEIRHTDLFIMLGLQKLNPETVQERAQELLTMSMDFARAAGRAGVQGNMWRN
ncbi:hypothetical protein LCGC14_2492450, partial [marine sediment metagenome]